jgi:hypothetical protein
MLFFFIHISAEHLLRLLGYSFCTECNILAHFCQMFLPIKPSKIIIAKNGDEIVAKLEVGQFLSWPGTNVIKLFTAVSYEFS